MMLEQKKRLEQLNTWFEIALDNMARGLSMFDANRRLMVCNKLYREIYDLPPELSKPGTPLDDIARYHVMRQKGCDCEAEFQRLSKWMDRHIAELAHGKSFSYVQDLPNGRHILVTIQPLPGGGWVDLQEDITEKMRAEQKITWLARHDTLTQIANRFHFREALQQEITGLQPNETFALHWIDLDKFKPVNDTFGHPAGDELLKSVAQRLRHAVRTSDIVGRLGGDEFAVLQRNSPTPEDAEHLARRLLHAIGKPHDIAGKTVHVEASIGIALAPQHGRTVDTLLSNADIALYNAKSEGGRRITDARHRATQHRQNPYSRE
ncbi:MAG TPA: diguanylate cyclase, partial [Planctomycetes bacterium]|nr:diguanylate cyclase [Planctomycetota bacterium]